MAVIRGLFIAPTWATVWHVLGNFVTINGKAGMVILIGGSTGQIVFPALCGFLMEKYGPVVLPAQQFACSCILLIVYGIFTWVTKYVFSRKFKKLSETPKTTAVSTYFFTHILFTLTCFFIQIN